MKAKKITTNNYFETIEEIGFENLPLVLKQSHMVIMTKTDNGRDWSKYQSDADLKRMINLAFRKLEEFSGSNKNNDAKGLDGTPEKKKRENPYGAISTEVRFINRFLEFHDKILYKKTFEIFIDELQKAIQEKKITKKSTVAKDIVAIQQAVLNAFNTMKNAKHFVLKPTTIKHLKSIIEKYENAYDDIDDDYVKTKKKKMDLSGIETAQQVNIMPSTDFTNLHFDSIGFSGKWLDFIGDPAPGFTAMVFGMPKMGKSYLCVDFAGYLARNHGRVLYVAKEEKLDATLQQKLKDKNVAHENLFVADALPKDLSAYEFIFLDSVNKLGLTPKDLERLKTDNKGKSFIYVFQATKGGKFKGNNEFQHDVDVVIEVPEQGKAVQFGRFNQGGEIDIFENNETPKESLEGVSKKKKYPSWTEPKHLNEADHYTLKHIYDLYKAGKLKEAYDYALYSADTIIREEIPGELWKEMGGQLTKTGEERLKKNRKLLSVSKDKSITLKTELGLSLEELAMEFVKEGDPKEEIINIIDNKTKLVEKEVTKMAEAAIEEEGLTINVKSVKFSQMDSNKIATGAVYFEVVLEGNKNELKKIAGEDKLFYCEW
ncbi:MAG: hypothetical protein Q8T03_13305 [Bacteroidota bacterium]|nr:hypothetical protein [Bacteroidota bacterium]MDP3558343.1 hypothetical protein [Bacteroidota bacterium]